MLPTLFLAQPLALPPARIAHIGPAQTWSIREIPYHVSDDDRVARVTVKGRVVTVRATKRLDHISGVIKGSDDTLLITRYHLAGIEEGGYTSEDTIWVNGKEHVLPGGAGIYRDRHNYAGANSERVSWISDSCPHAFLVKNDRRTDLGPGNLEYWGPQDTFVLSEPVDEEGHPSESKLTAGYVTRIVDKSGSYTLPNVLGARYSVLGGSSDGTIDLAYHTQVTWSSDWDTYLGAHAPSFEKLLRFKAGRVTGHLEIPAPWRCIGRFSDGRVLLRRVRPWGGWYTGLRVSVQRHASFFVRANEDQGLDDWTLGILKGDQISPIRFTRPTNSLRCTWSSQNTSIENSAVNIRVSGDGKDRSFRLSPQ